MQRLRKFRKNFYQHPLSKVVEDMNDNQLSILHNSKRKGKKGSGK